MDHDPFIGQTIGSYRILSKFGEGGMGAVYKAVHGKIKREVALKILPQRLVQGNPHFVERFFREAEAAAKVEHPNIVQVYDAEEVEGVYYIAMQFVRGMDVKDLLKRKSPLTEAEALDLILQAAKGLGAAQKHGIIHRDIKPANLMVTADGLLKVADFGLAKNLEAETELTQSGQIMGTPAYMSPEQADGQKVDFRSDLYSLGVCLFEMVTGGKPYVADTPIGLIKKHCLDPVPDPAQRLPGLRPGFCSVITRLMAKKPEERFPSHDALVTELENVQREIQEASIEADGPEPGKERTLSDIYMIVEESILSAENLAAEPSAPDRTPRSTPDTTPTPSTTGASQVRAGSPPGGLKPIHLVLTGVGGAALVGAVLAVLFFSGVFGKADEEGAQHGSAPRSGSGQDRPPEQDLEDAGREALEAARALRDAGDMTAAIAALSRIESDYPTTAAAREVATMKALWQEEKRKSDAREREIQEILSQVETLESARRYDDALAVLSRAVALDPDHPEVTRTGNRIRFALETAKTAKERDEAYEKYMTEADLARIRAEGSKKASDWVLVVEAASTAQANRDTEAVQGLLAHAKGWRDLCLAVEAEQEGNLEEALRLVVLAGSHGAEIQEIGEFTARVKANLAKKKRLAGRKARFDQYSGEAQAEEDKGPAADPAVALAYWNKALGFADRPEDKRKAQARIDALSAQVQKREARAKRDEAVAAARKALDSGNLDEAERLFREALSHVSGDTEATRGLRQVAAARVDARYKAAMEEGRRAEQRKDWKAAAAAYERALDAKQGDRTARTAVERVKRNLSSLPSGFEATFEVPTASRDQHGNPVVTRNGSRIDPDTGFPFEIWMKNPRIEFVLIPAGEFMMGSPESEVGRSNDEGPVHRVRITKPFYLAKYEVTQAQWRAVMGSDPSHFENAGDDAPVEQVSWNDCQEFLKKLNTRVGAQHAAPLRLPTEAEWEYACRAGTRTAIYTGDLTLRGENDGPELDSIAWYGGNSGVTYEGGVDSSGWPEKQYDHSRAGTHPVGRKKPNAWGLYDMIGNVWEWCEDVYDSGFYGKPEATRPDPVSTSGSSYRVYRGGCWSNSAQYCRSAYRNGNAPSSRTCVLGFRPSRPLR